MSQAQKLQQFIHDNAFQFHVIFPQQVTAGPNFSEDGSYIGMNCVERLYTRHSPDVYEVSVSHSNEGYRTDDWPFGFKEWIFPRCDRENFFRDFAELAQEYDYPTDFSAITRFLSILQQKIASYDASRVKSN